MIVDIHTCSHICIRSYMYLWLSNYYEINFPHLLAIANYFSMGSARQSDETMDDDNDDKDDTKRKSRNLSEKKRRDQFNMLVNELGSMVTTNTRKMDKSTVLRSTILFLKNHDEIAVRSRVHEIQEDWKPSFLSNEEFTHLILEALDGFIMVFSSNGRIYYASESVTSLLGYLPSELSNKTIYEITYQDDQSHLYNVLLNPSNDPDQCGVNEEQQVSFTCHIRRGGLDFREETIYELVQFVGYFRSDTDIETLIPNNRLGNNVLNDTKLIFVGTGRLQTPQLIRDMSFVDNSKSEFTSRHSLEWKFLFLDHRAPPIIGYLPFEVLGTSGYDYYHVDDLEKVVICHESLMQKGEGTSCHYRFLTKGQQWIWLKTRFYIDYNQWNSKPEFIVCTHNVVSYTEVMKQLKTKNHEDSEKNKMDEIDPTTASVPQQTTQCQARPSVWSSKSSTATKSGAGTSKLYYRGGGSDTTSVSAGSHSSRQSVSTTQSARLRTAPTNLMKLQTPPEPPPKHRRHTENDRSNSRYVDQQIFSTDPMQPVVPTNFVSPVVPAVPSTALMNQQNLGMAAAQHNIQDELQRKHEELQQLIVHQQEELRRVSEQLLIARYGILSPLINLGLPYSTTPSQTPISRNSSPNAGAIANNPPNHTVQEINVLPIPVELPIPAVPIEQFPHPSASLSADDIMMAQPSQEQHQQQRQQQQQINRHEQLHQHQGQPQQLTHHDDHMSPMIGFQLCSQVEIPYANLDVTPSTQHRLNH